MVVGTRFELTSLGSKILLRVEEGNVRLEVAGKSREVGPLHQIEAEGTRIGEPEPVALHEIACWKFKQDKVAPGTILFQDDFENGLGKWDIQSGDFGIVEDKGRAGNHYLRLRWKAGEEPTPIIFASFIPRHRDFEISFRVFPPKNKCASGVAPFLPGDPTRPVAIKGTSGTSRYKVFGGHWHSRRYEVRRRDISYAVYFRGKRLQEQKGRIQGPFARLGLSFSNTDKDTEIVIDDVVVRKLRD